MREGEEREKEERKAERGWRESKEGERRKRKKERTGKTGRKGREEGRKRKLSVFQPTVVDIYLFIFLTASSVMLWAVFRSGSHNLVTVTLSTLFTASVSLTVSAPRTRWNNLTVLPPISSLSQSGWCVKGCIIANESSTSAIANNFSVLPFAISTLISLYRELSDPWICKVLYFFLSDSIAV